MATWRTVTSSVYELFTKQYGSEQLSQDIFVDAVLYLCIIATMIPDDKIMAELPMDLLDSWALCFVREYPAYVSQLPKNGVGLSSHEYWKTTRRVSGAGSNYTVLDFGNVLEIQQGHAERSTQIMKICINGADAVLEAKYMPSRVPSTSRREYVTSNISERVRRAAIDRLFNGHPPQLPVVPRDHRENPEETGAGMMAYRRWKSSTLATHKTIIADYVDAGLRNFAEEDDVLAFWRLYHGFISGVCEGW